MTAWEYGLIAAIICLGIIGSLTLLGTSTLHGFTVVSSTVAATNSGR
jgi:Flp pilus assembly pilin Flp